jgi:hypothetical protein
LKISLCLLRRTAFPPAIVRTVGPASPPEKVLKQLIQEGMMKGLQKIAQEESDAHLVVRQETSSIF